MKVYIILILLLLECHRAENNDNNNDNNDDINDNNTNNGNNVDSNSAISHDGGQAGHLNDVLTAYLDGFEQRDKNKKCSEIETKVETFLNETEELFGKAESSLVLAMFEIAINATEEKAEQLQKENKIYADFQLNLSKKAYDILQEDKDTLEKCNKKLLRVLKIIYMESALIPFREEDRLKDSELNKEINLRLSKLSVTKDGKELYLVGDIDPLIATSRDYNELQWVWEQWFNGASKSLKDIYEESVALLDASVKERGFSSIAEVAQLQDFEESIEEEMLTIMNEIMPLYQQLHAYVRNKLFDFYGEKDLSDEHKAYFADKTNPIPIHILGDIYGQTWENLKDIVTPYPEIKLDVDENLKKQNFTVSNLTKLSEDFFLSLGFEPMNDIFWKESVFERAPNVTMQCHPTAWSIKNPDDFRISMCAVPNFFFLGVIHHEMGHVAYYMQYRHLPFYFRTGANGAFHEAIGDTIALSVESVKHLTKLGFLTAGDDDDETRKRTINKLMKDALKVIAFIPYSYSLETWRYNLFKGQYNKDNANTNWWKLSLKYQGLVPPSNRSDPSLLDPTGKFHIPTHTQYARYFFSHIGMYQFHEALCKLASHEGPLHTCDIHGSEEAGKKFREILKKGFSEPWRDVMKVFTGSSSFNSAPLLQYFKPLHDWLVEQNEDVPIGWDVNKWD